MRLSTVRSDGATHAAVQAGDSWLLLDAPDVGALVGDPDWRSTVDTALGGGGRRIAEVEFVNPVPAPRKVLCCGLNYRDHIIETGRDVPEYPTLFAKFAETLTDPYADIVVAGSGQVDWEAELAVVVGADIHRADVETARRGILGYSVANDISMRDWQSRTLQWDQGKVWDRTTPLGPVIVTADEMDPRDGFAIECRIGDEVVQSASTAQLVFDAAQLVSYVSQFSRLRAGDIVLTGTPGGVGLGRSPRRWLADGDLLKTTIEGIGTLRNRIVLEPGVAS